MFPYCLYFVFILSTDAHFLHSNEDINKNINQKKDLINIINSLNSLNGNWTTNNKEYNKIYANDKTQELTDMEKEKKLQQMLWLIQTNYNAQKQYDFLQNSLHSGARLYVIRNPEAIDEYKNYLKQKKAKATMKQNIKNKLQQLRRKTMSGIDEDTYEDKLNEKKLPVDSLEIDNKKVHERSKYVDLSKEKSDIDIKNDFDYKKSKYRVASFDKYDEIDKIKLGKLARNNDKIVDNKWDRPKRSRQTYDIPKTTKFTTKKEFIKKDINRPNLKPKISYKKPKSDPKPRNRWTSYMRTSIPYVGKKGVYDDE